MRTHFRAKVLVGTRGGGGGGGNDVLKIFFLFPIFIIQKVTNLAPKLSRTFMEIGNKMQNHKIETNSELIYDDGSI